MEWLQDYWHQVLFIGFVLVNAIRAREQLTEAKRDLAVLQKQMDRVLRWTQDQQESLVVLQAENQVEKEQRRMLWEFTNKLRDMLSNGK
tara:strand:- start:2 stop:268 length:267 start_codon:yes stop_codon:yes gene_type:complete